jgi:hypothetical protein
MKRGIIIVTLCLAALAIAVVWHLLALPKLRLHYTGLRHDSVENRWFADFWFTNTLNRSIHCCGYQSKTANGLQTLNSLIDFQCTVGFEENRIQAWPLWLAISLDLKPGEAVRLSLDLPPAHPPTRVGVIIVKEIHRDTKIERSLHRLTNRLPGWLWPPPKYTETIWSAASLAYPPNFPAATNDAMAVTH